MCMCIFVVCGQICDACVRYEIINEWLIYKPQRNLLREDFLFLFKTQLTLAKGKQILAW